MACSFLYDNKIVSFGGTLSATSTNPSYPVTNVKNYNAASPWRSVDSGAVYYLVHDFGSATNVNITALANLNLSSSTIMKIQASTTSNFAVLNVDETIQTGSLNTSDRFNLYHKLAQAYVYRYWRLEIDDGGNPDGFYQVGEWFLGLHTTLTTGQQFEMPWTKQYPDTNVIHQTEYQQDYVYIRDLKALKIISVEWRGVTSSTKNSLKTMFLSTKGSGKPLFLCPDDSSVSTPEAFFVRIIGDFEETQEKSSVFSARMTFRELARGVTLPSVE